jgi:hypothetical protein
MECDVFNAIDSIATLQRFNPLLEPEPRVSLAQAGMPVGVRVCAWARVGQCARASRFLRRRVAVSS